MNSKLEIASDLKKTLIVSLFILLLLAAIPKTAAAQEATPDEPTYTVQPGDTLSKIAQRFDLSVEDIITVNELANPDNITSGTKIILPGVDWVSGDLVFQAMPLGETYRSITRRYHLDTALFTRLSGVISPSQLAAGYPLLLSSDGTTEWDAGRSGLAAQRSLLELAVTTGSNPWKLKAVNQLQASWQALPGDVFLSPGSGEPGPGALPSPITQITYDGDTLVQGKTAVIRVGAGGLPLELNGELMGATLNFFNTGENNFVALQGVHVLADPGAYPLTIGGVMEDGAAFSFSQLVTVADGGYARESLTIDRDQEYLLDDEITVVESKIIKDIVTPVNPEKMWDSYFVPPSPYSEVINSVFGTRRSFNGSPYDFYHSGVDFGGGVGVEIYAVAPGVVVFTNTLEVRGMATVIDHGWGVYSGYWHQSEIKVREGERVEPGQVIGLVGSTGRSTGGHLHWELWVGGVQVDPLDWLYNVYP